MYGPFPGAMSVMGYFGSCARTLAGTAAITAIPNSNQAGVLIVRLLVPRLGRRGHVPLTGGARAILPSWLSPATILTIVRRATLPVLIFWAGAAHGAVVYVSIKTGVVLRPGETFTLTLQATEPTEIGWQAVQAKRCTANCVQATDLAGGLNYAIATPLGASMKYRPVAGRISIEYKNVSGEPVTIDLYRVKRTCEAEACRFLDEGQKGRWLVFKIDEFTSITTSKDGSYSVISGVAESGRPFSFRAVWWTEDKTALVVNCAPFVKGFLDHHTPKEQYRPYVISGQAVGEPDKVVLKSIDTCAPKAAKFGVPEKNVFK